MTELDKGFRIIEATDFENEDIVNPRDDGLSHELGCYIESILEIKDQK